MAVLFSFLCHIIQIIDPSLKEAGSPRGEKFYLVMASLRGQYENNRLFKVTIGFVALRIYDLIHWHQSDKPCFCKQYTVTSFHHEVLQSRIKFHYYIVSVQEVTKQNNYCCIDGATRYCTIIYFNFRPLSCQRRFKQSDGNRNSHCFFLIRNTLINVISDL